MKSMTILFKAAVAIILFCFSLPIIGCGSSGYITGEDQNSISTGKKINAEYVPGELLVKFRGGTPSQTASGLHNIMKAVKKKEFKKIRVHHLKLSGSITVAEAIQHYQHDPNVEYAEPNYIIHAAAVPDDRHFDKLWGLDNNGQTGGTSDADIDAPEAWDAVTGSHNIIIAVIDSGLTLNHPDFSDNIWKNTGETVCTDSIDNDANGFVDDCYGWDFIGNDNDPTDFDGHGTHVAGTIAAQGNNSSGITGVIWDASIMPLRILGTGGSGTTANAVSAILYANARGAHIINNSWGGSGYSQAMKDAIDVSGAVVVCAAGNSGTDNDSLPFYPASYTSPNIISVAATDHNDMLAPFSNYGANSVDIAAPGVSIYSTIPTLNFGPPVTLYSEDFNGATGNLPLLGWERGGIKSTWAVTGGTGISGTNSLEDSPGTNYMDNTGSWAGYMTPFTSVKDNRYILSFQWKGNLQPAVDYLDINYSPDGINWSFTDFTTGSTNGNFISHSSDFTSVADTLDSFYIGFGLASDNAINHDGVYIDNVSLTRESASISGFNYKYESGASMAAPHVSGAAGLVLSSNSSLSNLQTREIILNASDLRPSLAGLTATGGRLNAHNAVMNSALPDAPSNMTATAISSSQIDLEWRDNSNNESGFRIDRREGAEGTYLEIAAVGPDITEYNDSGLAPATLYYYIVRAYNSAGASAYSNEAGARTDDGNSENSGSSGCSIISGEGAGSVDIIMVSIPFAVIFFVIMRLRNVNRFD